MAQDEIDAAIQTYYGGVFDESTRLTTRSPQGRLEFERTQEVVRAATPAPARILDVGGATGVHAAALARDGYEVVLVDPVASQVAAASRIGTFSAAVGDARDLDFADVSDADYSAALRLARTFGDAPDIRDFSNHLLGSGTA